MSTFTDWSELDRLAHLLETSNVWLPGQSSEHLVKHESVQNLAVQKSKVLQSTQIITRAVEGLQVLLGICSNVKPGGAPVVVGVDCERYSDVQLLQLAYDGRAYIFDLASCPELITDGGLKLVLESKVVVKVFHYCCVDSVDLKSKFGVSLRSVFDTQACHAVLQEMATGTPALALLRGGPPVELNDLLLQYALPLNPLKKEMKRAPAPSWAHRPLTEEMIVYAAANVLPLPRLYNIMIRQITPEYRGRLAELCDARVKRFLGFI